MLRVHRLLAPLSLSALLASLAIAQVVPSESFEPTSQLTAWQDDEQAWAEPAIQPSPDTHGDPRGDDPVCGCMGADSNANGSVDLGDLAHLLSEFGGPASGPLDCADLNQDGHIGIGDLAVFLAVFGTNCDPPSCPDSTSYRATEPFYEIAPELNEWCIYFVWRVQAGTPVAIGRVYIRANAIPSGFCCPWTTTWWGWDWELKNNDCSQTLGKGDYAYIGRWSADLGPPPGPCWARCP